MHFTNGTKLTPHHKVSLEVTGERSDMENWHKSASGTWLHEGLHMYGVKDEYLNKKSYPEKSEADLPPDSTKGIMRNTSTGIVLNRHIDEIVERSQLNGLKGCEVSATTMKK